MKATVCPFALSFSISKEGGEGGGGNGEGVALYTALNWEVPLYWIFFSIFTVTHQL